MTQTSSAALARRRAGSLSTLTNGLKLGHGIYQTSVRRGPPAHPKPPQVPCPDRIEAADIASLGKIAVLRQLDQPPPKAL